MTEALSLSTPDDEPPRYELIAGVQMNVNGLTIQELQLLQAGATQRCDTAIAEVAMLEEVIVERFGEEGL